MDRCGTPYSEWSTDLEDICSEIIEYQSNLKLFKPEYANTIAMFTVLHIKCACPCDFSSFHREISPSSERDRATSIGEHSLGGNVPLHPLRDALLSPFGASVRRQVNIFTYPEPTHAFHLISASEVQWAMHSITYGLMMPFEHWPIVKHSVHIYCSWLSAYLNMTNVDKNRPSLIPVTISRDPLGNLRSILYSLVYFFLPRLPEPLSDRPLWLLASIDPSPSPFNPTTSHSTTQATATEPLGFVSHPDSVSDSSPATSKPNTQALFTSLQFDLVNQIADIVERLSNSPVIQASPEAWNVLLRFCLITCHVSLVLPSHSSTLPPIGDRLSDPVLSSPSLLVDVGLANSPTPLGAVNDRLVTMLFRVWISACCSSFFPKPQLWLALRTCLIQWRHQPAVANLWSHVVRLFTHRLVNQLYPNANSSNHHNGSSTLTSDDNVNDKSPSDSPGVHGPFTLPLNISPVCVEQACLRFLFTLGNPVDLCHPSTILPHNVFREWSSAGVWMDRIINADHYLPYAFHQSTHTLSSLVDAMLGLEPSLTIGCEALVGVPSHLYGGGRLVSSSLTSPTDLNRSNALSNVPAKIGRARTTARTRSSTTSTSSLQHDTIPVQPSAKDRLGDKASLWLDPSGLRRVRQNRPEINSLLRLIGSWLFEASVTGHPSDLNNDVISTRAQHVDLARFQIGRAEAVGALCRCFIYARRSLSKEYLCRFYMCLHYALDPKTSPQTDYILSTVLFNSVDLLSVDLPGCLIILPRLFIACQRVFKSDLARPDHLSRPLLVRAAIYQLMAMVCIPFQVTSNYVVKCLIPNANHLEDPLSFNTLKLQLTAFLPLAIDSESDPTNYRLLLNTALAHTECMAAESVRFDQHPQNQRPAAVNREASSFFTNLATLLCEHLLEKWSSHASVTPCLLEILLGMAYIDVVPSEPTIYRHVIGRLCNFITNQCNRDPKDHRRQLHTVIVTAFICLSHWLSERGHLLLLADNSCIQLVLQTIGLCITGSTSKDRMSSSRPSFNAPSKRVREVAESCLGSLMSRWLPGQVSNPRNTVGSHLIEDHILQMLGLDQQRHKFEYYWSHPGVLVGFLELSRYCLTSPLPALIFILRGPFGRHVWIWRIRQSTSKATTGTLMAESNALSVSVTPLVEPQLNGCFLNRLLKTDTELTTTPVPNFPESISDIDVIEPDQSTGVLESVGDSARDELNLIKTHFNSQQGKLNTSSHSIVNQRIASSYPDPLCKLDCPDLVKSFQSHRKLLANLGYALNMLQQDDLPASLPGRSPSDSLSRSTDKRERQSMFRVNTTSDDSFADQLLELDRLPTRTSDTLLLFYAAAGQAAGDCQSVVDNMNTWFQLPATFKQFVKSLGSLTSLDTHTGWTGNPDTSYLAKKGHMELNAAVSTSSHYEAVPDGRSHIIYSANASNEFACFCPSSLPDCGCGEDKLAELLTADPTGGRLALVWLENWEDCPLTSSDSPGRQLHASIASYFSCPLIVFIHPLTSMRLYRVALVAVQPQGGNSKSTVCEAAPLQNGLLLTKHALTSFVIQAVANIGRRRRLASDIYQPPHVKRARRIAGFVQNTPSSANDLDPSSSAKLIGQLFTSLASDTT